MKLSRTSAALILVAVFVRADEPLPPGLRVVLGPVNGAVIEREGKSLAVYGDPSGRLPAPDMLLLTQACRDAT